MSTSRRSLQKAALPERPFACRSLSDFLRHRIGIALTLLALVASAPLTAQNARSVNGALLELEEQLLQSDATALREQRRSLQTARQQIEEREERLASALVGELPPRAELDRLRQALVESRAAAAEAQEAFDRLWWRIEGRLDRMVALRSNLGQVDDRLREVTPAYGRWLINVQPEDLSGTFRLRQNGAVVTGTYTLGDGSAGSLRGTFVDGELELERVDRSLGFDRIFLGRLSTTGNEIEGTWQPTTLSDGGPGGGTWTARRPEEQE
ncbi:MAG: hypothetical protein AAF604_01130 [Acidobacteriota bacterium]